jgi:hypothetical protein
MVSHPLTQGKILSTWSGKPRVLEGGDIAMVSSTVDTFLELFFKAMSLAALECEPPHSAYGFASW